MSRPGWPDALQRPDPARLQRALAEYWVTLAALAELLPRDELLLAETTIVRLRELVLELMLALNGIAPPVGTLHLNGYLGPSQRAALQRTLISPTADGASVVARAVALTVIYRWYAPQLMRAHGLAYPYDAEAAALRALVHRLPDWPEAITTETDPA